MLKRSELQFDRSVFPRRVVDLRATLGSSGGVCLCVPEDWSFHVISHTWSQDIRNLIDRAKLLQSGGRKLVGLSYNGAFANARFGGEPWYEALLEFLRVLAADGVGKIWLDALCINQQDEEETNLEIQNMGAYYRLSAGCYVVTHGIGAEFGFKPLDWAGNLPRWFTRAWTLQESILPDKLSFIVEKFDSRIMQCIEEHPWTDADNWWDDWEDEEEEFSRRRIPYYKEGCKELYRLDTKAYRMMMHTLICVRECYFKDLQDNALRLNFNRSFGTLHKGCEDIDVEVVVKHIRRRECFKEEDRVLSILGLLGITGHHQVTTNLTLDLQLLRLAKTLMEENPQLLVNLSAANLEGYGGGLHISWLPDLRYKRFSRFENDLSQAHELEVVRRYTASLMEMRDNGSIVMRAPAVRGCLRRDGSTNVEHDTPYHLDIDHLFTIHLRQVRPDIGLPWPYEWNRTNDVVIPLQDSDCLLSIEPNGPLNFSWGGGLSIPAHGIHKLQDYQHHTTFTVCEVTILLLGHTGSSTETENLGPCVLMVCVGDANELHKVGILFCEEEHIEKVMELFSSNIENFVIGGFGDDLTSFLDTQSQAIIKSQLPISGEDELEEESVEITSLL